MLILLRGAVIEAWCLVCVLLHNVWELQGKEAEHLRQRLGNKQITEGDILVASFHGIFQSFEGRGLVRSTG